MKALSKAPECSMACADGRSPSGLVSLRGLLPALLLALAGCAGVQGPQQEHLGSADAELARCAGWFESLDAAVAQAGVGDVAARRVAGFPYLRIDRFLEALKPAAKADARLRQAWIEQLRERDADGRRVEIANLPAEFVAGLGAGDREAVLLRTRDCAERLASADLADSDALDTLFRNAWVDDDYASWKRALGLYELTRLPFHAGVEAWQQRVTEAFDAARRGELPSGKVLRYLPPDIPVYTRAEVAAILARAGEHPLGLPRLSAEQRDRLFATYAPVFAIETEGDFDRIGRLSWQGAAIPGVDVTQPVVYRRLDFTRVGERTLLQLVYLAWLPERPREGRFDLLGGQLDGLVWRVTLAPDGEPVLFDSIHPCGCYHMFLPTPRLEPVAPPETGIEWAFIPASLPALGEAERLVLDVQTRTHYLQNVWPGEPGEGKVYGFADYDELRVLPLPGGGSRSAFDADGLVAGSERGERFLFWPMGIASPGAMRQSGTQATAFVGRRHFDDADLVEKRFRLLD